MTFERDKRSPGVYRASRKDGLLIAKEFVPAQGDSLPLLRIRMENPTRRALRSEEWTLSIGPGLGTVASEQEENPKVWRAIGLLHGQAGLNGKIEQFKNAAAHAGPYRWVGVDNRYFLAAVVMPEEGFASVTAAPQPPQVTITAASVELAPGAARTWELPFYLGAKGNNILTRYGVGLERSIDFGFFAQLGRLVLRALGQIHKVTGNWGWSIIALTVLLQFLLFPLTYKSLKAAASMKKLQPEIAKLQQKYGKDPSRLNTETMELYKKSGANPLGGCLPMLMQMPIFIALFNALRNSWELHGAQWIFWITDLSAKDPYYVLPIVMGALGLLQQRLAPAPAADPAQAKIMMWMPVIFTFMFLKLPAGLVLYWLTNSAFSTLQQLALKDHFERQQ
jgi:YidC/Oxa1 family membrane protein insertase